MASISGNCNSPQRNQSNRIFSGFASSDVANQRRLGYQADAAWSDEALLGCTRDYALTAMTKTSSVAAWIVDDTGLPKKGTHSVGVARQDCGQTGKQDNCQVAVSLSVATWTASLPIAYRLYLPEIWANNSQLRQQAKIPNTIVFQTKLEIALGQIRQAMANGIPREL